jgi:hypothetical protein
MEDLVWDPVQAIVRIYQDRLTGRPRASIYSSSLSTAERLPYHLAPNKKYIGSTSGPAQARAREEATV